MGRQLFEGVLVLTVTVLLNTRPAEAACTATSCKNGGTCPDPADTAAVCDCSASSYKGATCEDACLVDGDCSNTGTCDTSGANGVCSCVDYKGITCADACLVDGDCSNAGTCDTSGANGVCSCGDYKGMTCADECSIGTDCDANGGTCAGTPKVCTCNDTTKKGPGCKTNKSGASAVTGFSLMSLLVVLTGYLL